MGKHSAEMPTDPNINGLGPGSSVYLTLQESAGRHASGEVGTSEATRRLYEGSIDDIEGRRLNPANSIQTKMLLENLRERAAVSPDLAPAGATSPEGLKRVRAGLSDAVQFAVNEFERVPSPNPQPAKLYEAPVTDAAVNDVVTRELFAIIGAEDTGEWAQSVPSLANWEHRSVDTFSAPTNIDGVTLHYERPRTGEGNMRIMLTQER